MAKNNKGTAFSNTGMMLVITYVVLFFVNGLVIYLANMFFPSQVVLGTLSMNALWAILHTSGKLSIILTLAVPFMNEIERRKGTAMSPVEAMVGYFFINLISIWIITRFSDQFGMGISSWYVAVAMAIVMDVVQGGVMVAIQKRLAA